QAQKVQHQRKYFLVGCQQALHYPLASFFHRMSRSHAKIFAQEFQDRLQRRRRAVGQHSGLVDPNTLPPAALSELKTKAAFPDAAFSHDADDAAISGKRAHKCGVEDIEGFRTTPERAQMLATAKQFAGRCVTYAQEPEHLDRLRKPSNEFFADRLRSYELLASGKGLRGQEHGIVLC